MIDNKYGNKQRLLVTRYSLKNRYKLWSITQHDNRRWD